MSELTDELAKALLEQRDLYSQMLAAMHKTHMRLLDTLSRMEARIGEQPPLDPNTMSQEALDALSERLWLNTSLQATVQNTFELTLSDAILSNADELWDCHIEDRVNDAISSAFNNLDVEVDNIELRITGKP